MFFSTEELNQAIRELRDQINPDRSANVVVAICFNMNLGDSWEWADVPEYPESIQRRHCEAASTMCCTT